MATKQIMVQRFRSVSSNSFQDVVSRLEAAVGHPDMSVFRREVASAKTFPDLEKIANQAVGPSGFMEFARFDHGEIVGKERGSGSAKNFAACGGQSADHEADG